MDTAETSGLVGGAVAGAALGTATMITLGKGGVELGATIARPVVRRVWSSGLQWVAWSVQRSVTGLAVNCNRQFQRKNPVRMTRGFMISDY